MSFFKQLFTVTALIVAFTSFSHAEEEFSVKIVGPEEDVVTPAPRAPARPARPAPARPAPAPARPVAATPARPAAQTPAPATPTRPVAPAVTTPARTTAAQTTPAQTTSPATTTQPTASAATPVAASGATGVAAAPLENIHTVAPRETIWSIAHRYSAPYDNVNEFQAVASIYRNNQTAFNNRDVNQLRTGATLRIPSQDVMALEETQTGADLLNNSIVDLPPLKKPTDPVFANKQPQVSDIPSFVARETALRDFNPSTSSQVVNVKADPTPVEVLSDEALAQENAAKDLQFVPEIASSSLDLQAIEHLLTKTEQNIQTAQNDIYKRLDDNIQRSAQVAQDTASMTAKEEVSQLINHYEQIISELQQSNSELKNSLTRITSQVDQIRNMQLETADSLSILGQQLDSGVPGSSNSSFNLNSSWLMWVLLGVGLLALLLSIILFILKSRARRNKDQFDDEDEFNFLDEDEVESSSLISRSVVSDEKTPPREAVKEPVAEESAPIADDTPDDNLSGFDGPAPDLGGDFGGFVDDGNTGTAGQTTFENKARRNFHDDIVMPSDPNPNTGSSPNLSGVSNFPDPSLMGTPAGGTNLGAAPVMGGMAAGAAMGMAAGAAGAMAANAMASAMTPPPSPADDAQMAWDNAVSPNPSAAAAIAAVKPNPVSAADDQWAVSLGQQENATNQIELGGNDAFAAPADTGADAFGGADAFADTTAPADAGGFDAPAEDFGSNTGDFGGGADALDSSADSFGGDFGADSAGADATGDAFGGDFGSDSTGADATGDTFGGDFGSDSAGTDSGGDAFGGDFGADTTGADAGSDAFGGDFGGEGFGDSTSGTDAFGGGGDFGGADAFGGEGFGDDASAGADSFGGGDDFGGADAFGGEGFGDDAAGTDAFGGSDFGGDQDAFGGGDFEGDFSDFGSDGTDAFGGGDFGGDDFPKTDALVSPEVDQASAEVADQTSDHTDSSKGSEALNANKDNSSATVQASHTLDKAESVEPKSESIQDLSADPLEQHDSDEAADFAQSMQKSAGVFAPAFTKAREPKGFTDFARTIASDSAVPQDDADIALDDFADSFADVNPNEDEDEIYQGLSDDFSSLDDTQPDTKLSKTGQSEPVIDHAEAEIVSDPEVLAEAAEFLEPTVQFKDAEVTNPTEQDTQEEPNFVEDSQESTPAKVATDTKDKSDSENHGIDNISDDEFNVLLNQLDPNVTENKDGIDTLSEDNFNELIDNLAKHPEKEPIDTITEAEFNDLIGGLDKDQQEGIDKLSEDGFNELMDGLHDAHNNHQGEQDNTQEQTASEEIPVEATLQGEPTVDDDSNLDDLFSNLGDTGLDLSDDESADNRQDDLFQNSDNVFGLDSQYSPRVSASEQPHEPQTLAEPTQDEDLFSDLGDEGLDLSDLTGNENFDSLNSDDSVPNEDTLLDNGNDLAQEEQVESQDSPSDYDSNEYSTAPNGYVKEDWSAFDPVAEQDMPDIEEAEAESTHSLNDADDEEIAEDIKRHEQVPERPLGMERIIDDEHKVFDAESEDAIYSEHPDFERVEEDEVIDPKMIDSSEDIESEIKEGATIGDVFDSLDSMPKLDLHELGLGDPQEDVEEAEEPTNGRVDSEQESDFEQDFTTPVNNLEEEAFVKKPLSDEDDLGEFSFDDLASNVIDEAESVPSQSSGLDDDDYAELEANKNKQNLDFEALADAVDSGELAGDSQDDATLDQDADLDFEDLSKHIGLEQDLADQSSDPIGPDLEHDYFVEHDPNEQEQDLLGEDNAEQDLSVMPEGDILDEANNLVSGDDVAPENSDADSYGTENADLASESADESVVAESELEPSANEADELAAKFNDFAENASGEGEVYPEQDFIASEMDDLKDTFNVDDDELAAIKQDHAEHGESDESKNLAQSLNGVEPTLDDEENSNQDFMSDEEAFLHNQAGIPNEGEAFTDLNADGNESDYDYVQGQDLSEVLEPSSGTQAKPIYTGPRADEDPAEEASRLASTLEPIPHVEDAVEVQQPSVDSLNEDTIYPEADVVEDTKDTDVAKIEPQDQESDSKPLFTEDELASDFGQDSLDDEFQGLSSYGNQRQEDLDMDIPDLNQLQGASGSEFDESLDLDNIDLDHFDAYTDQDQFDQDAEQSKASPSEDVESANAESNEDLPDDVDYSSQEVEPVDTDSDENFIPEDKYASHELHGLEDIDSNKHNDSNNVIMDLPENDQVDGSVNTDLDNMSDLEDIDLDDFGSLDEDVTGEDGNVEQASDEQSHDGEQDYSKQEVESVDSESDENFIPEEQYASHELHGLEDIDSNKHNDSNNVIMDLPENDQVDGGVNTDLDNMSDLEGINLDDFGSLDEDVTGEDGNVDQASDEQDVASELDYSKQEIRHIDDISEPGYIDENHLADHELHGLESIDDNEDKDGSKDVLELPDTHQIDGSSGAHIDNISELNELDLDDIDAFRDNAPEDEQAAVDDNIRGVEQDASSNFEDEQELYTRQLDTSDAIEEANSSRLDAEHLEEHDFHGLDNIDNNEHKDGSRDIMELPSEHEMHGTSVLSDLDSIGDMDMDFIDSLMEQNVDRPNLGEGSDIPVEDIQDAAHNMDIDDEQLDNKDYAGLDKIDNNANDGYDDAMSIPEGDELAIQNRSGAVTSLDDFDSFNLDNIDKIVDDGIAAHTNDTGDHATRGEQLEQGQEVGTDSEAESESPAMWDVPQDDYDIAHMSGEGAQSDEPSEQVSVDSDADMFSEQDFAGDIQDHDFEQAQADESAENVAEDVADDFTSGEMFAGSGDSVGREFDMTPPDLEPKEHEILDSVSGLGSDELLNMLADDALDESVGDGDLNSAGFTTHSGESFDVDESDLSNAGFTTSSVDAEGEANDTEAKSEPAAQTQVTADDATEESGISDISDASEATSAFDSAMNPLEAEAIDLDDLSAAGFKVESGDDFGVEEPTESTDPAEPQGTSEADTVVDNDFADSLDDLSAAGFTTHSEDFDTDLSELNNASANELDLSGTDIETTGLGTQDTVTQDVWPDFEQDATNDDGMIQNIMSDEAQEDDNLGLDIDQESALAQNDQLVSDMLSEDNKQGADLADNVANADADSYADALSMARVMFETGSFEEAKMAAQEVINNSGDPRLVAEAQAMLEDYKDFLE